MMAGGLIIFTEFLRMKVATSSELQMNTAVALVVVCMDNLGVLTIIV